MSKLTSFLMLFSLISFGILNVNAQVPIQDQDPNASLGAILPSSGGTVIDGDGDWTTLSSLPAGVSTSGSAAAYLDGKVYHFGGSPGPSAEYQVWDEATDVWTSSGTMPGGARYYGSAETVAGKIYHIGGSQAWPTPTGMVEIFDGTTWTTGTPMPTALHDIATAVYQDRYIYTIGGMVGSWTDFRNSVFVYDTQTDTWATATNFPVMASCMAGGCVGNTIVVAGDYDGNTYTSIYKGEINASDPTVITWTLSTATLRDAVYRPSGGAAAGIVFFAGGQTAAGTASNQALGYDPVTDVVTMFPDKPTPVANMVNFVPGDNMMYFMGGYDGGYNLACEGMEYDMGGGVNFTDNFDSYIAGEQLACQNPTDWTTWDLIPCDPTEDPYVSSNYAYSGANSVVIVQNNDLVHVYDPAGAITSGTWYASLLIYIPTGKSGYFNELATFTGGTYNWGLECYFNAGGAGSLNAGGTGAASFTWQEDTWQQAVVVVDVDNDVAEFWFGDSDPLTMIYSWQWTLGSNGVAIPLSIDGNDIFGAAATDEMYIDNYYFGDAMPPIIPVELSSFTATASEGLVELSWITATETNNQGFEVQRSSGGEFETIGFVDGNGTTTETHVYSYSDRNVNSGSYSYRLKQIDFDGTFAYSNVVEVEVPAAPTVYALEQNYPNPFNPSTTINFKLAVDSKVSLKVFDLLGQQVATLLNSNMTAGSHQVDFNASSLNSGMYLYKIEATGIDGTNFTNVKKMMLLK